MVDWGGKVATWFFSAAAVSAALAGYFATTARQPLHGMMRMVVTALVVIAVVSFLIALATGLRAAWVAWRNRKEAKGRRPDPAKPSVSYEGITLELADDPKWDLWRGKAWIADVQVRVTNNTTPGRVITLMSPHLESDPGPFWAERPRLAPDEVKALFEETLSRSPLNPHMGVKPGESRVIRVVSNVFLPYPAHEGKPYCEFVVTDAGGKIYTRRVTALDSPGSSHKPALMRLRNLAMEGRGLREQIHGQNESDGTSPDPDQGLRFESWINRAGGALKLWPDLQAQFQAGRAAVTDSDPAWVAQRMELLEEMLRALDGRRRRDAQRAPLPSASNPVATSQQRSTFAHVRRLLDEGRSLQGALDRAPPPTVPPGLPDRVEGWEMMVRAGLESRPDLCARFEAAQFVGTRSAPDDLSNRLKARLGVLEAIEQELIEAGD